MVEIEPAYCCQMLAVVLPLWVTIHVHPRFYATSFYIHLSYTTPQKIIPHIDNWKPSKKVTLKFHFLLTNESFTFVGWVLRFFHYFFWMKSSQCTTLCGFPCSKLWWKWFWSNLFYFFWGPYGCHLANDILFWWCAERQSSNGELPENYNWPWQNN